METKKKGVPHIEFRPALFWDTNPKTIDPDKNAVYVIERIMDFGTDDEERWMWRYYDRTLIRDVAKSSRTIFPETRSFWNLVLAA